MVWLAACKCLGRPLHGQFLPAAPGQPPNLHLCPLRPCPCWELLVSDHVLPPHWPFVSSWAAALQGCPHQVSTPLGTPSAAANIRWTWRSWAPPLVALMPGGLGQGQLSWVCLEELLHVVLGPQHRQVLGGWGGRRGKRVQSFRWGWGADSQRLLQGEHLLSKVSVEVTSESQRMQV